LPLVKFTAIATLVAYAVGKLIAGERLTIWPLEMKMLALIVTLGILFVPIAFRPQNSIDLLTDSFFKVITIFVLIVNLIDSRKRLNSMMKLVVFCGFFIAVVAIKNYLTGELDITHILKLGLKLGQPITVGDYFDNTNELALTLDLILPFAVVFAVISRGMTRLVYWLCAAVIAIGVVITFSRGGFLGLVSMGSVLMWKLGRGKRMTMVFASLLLAGALASAMPTAYSDRLFTIVHPADDPTNSAQERQLLLKRAVYVALHHPLIGIGLSNFHEYSYNGKAAHNSYVEIAAELGWTGLLAYLTFLLCPFRSLRRIERACSGSESSRLKAGNPVELYYLSIALQGVMIAFMVCSLFSSSQYYWHPYYIVGYSIALRRIHAAEVIEGEVKTPAEVAPTRGKGAIWKIAGQQEAV
jgi:O-antigen ligase